MRIPRFKLGKTRLAQLFCGVLIGFSLVILGAYWINRSAALHGLEADALRDMEREAGALSAAVSEQTRGAIYNLDLALLFLSHHFPETHRLDEHYFADVMRTTPGGLLRRAQILDREGRVAASYPAGDFGLDLRSAAHFEAHAGEGERGLFIGRPVRGRADGEWLIPLSRRLTDRDGRFAGVIAVLARPEYFSEIYGRLSVGRNDVVALLLRDGSYLSRSRSLYEHLGKAVRPDRPFIGDAAPERGSFRDVSTFETVDRVFAFRRLGEWPLVVVVGLETAGRLKPVVEGYRRDRQSALAVSALVVLLLAGICIVIVRLERSLVRVSESDQRRALAFAGASELAWEWDVPRRLVRFFGNCRPYFGGEDDERQITIERWVPNIHPDDREAVRAQTRDYLLGRVRTLESRYRLRFAKGDYRWVLVRGQSVQVETDGRVRKAIGILMDVDAHRKAEIAAAQTKEAYQRLIESAGEGIFVVDRFGVIQLFNPAAERVLGWTSAEVIGRPAHPILHGAGEGSEPVPSSECPLLQTLADGQPRSSVRLAYRHKNGATVPVEISVSPISLDGLPDGAVALISDVSRQIAYEAELQRLARTDGLTGLWNRRYFVELFERELRRADREESPLSLLMVDIDHFKQINDQYGHAAGDAVLVALAGHFRAQLRQIDIVGRLGGEEFGVALPGVPVEEAQVAAERLRGGLEALDIVFGEHAIRCTVSIGVALWSRPESFDALLARADAALYEAKNGGRNRVVVRPLRARLQAVAPPLPGSAG